MLALRARRLEACQTELLLSLLTMVHSPRVPRLVRHLLTRYAVKSALWLLLLFLLFLLPLRLLLLFLRLLLLFLLFLLLLRLLLLLLRRNIQLITLLTGL